MAFTAYETVSPHFMVPESVLQIAQKSGAFDLLHQSKMDVRLDTDTQYVYVKSLEVRTDAIAGQSATNSLRGPQFVTKLNQCPTYMIQMSYQYNGHDVAAAGNWNVSLTEAYRLGTWQSFAQNERNALLYGFQPANGEGILNATGITNVTLPADSNGNTTFRTYDNGQLAFQFLTIIASLKANQFLNAQAGNRVVICGPQRELAFMLQANIVQLVQYQRQGAGSLSSGQVVQVQMEGFGDTIDWRFDDTLQGQGQGGTDAIIFATPDLEEQRPNVMPDTNAFGKLQPNYKANVTMFADMVAPRELIAPLPRGYTDVTAEKRITPGWVIRPQSVQVLSIAY